MSDVPSPLAHQFEDLNQQSESASLGMWLFLLTEIMFFGGLFTGYTVYRWQYPEAWLAGSHHVGAGNGILLGGFNTVVLILSSLTMALGVHAAQMGKRKAIIFWLVLTILFGGTFLGVKAIEYHHKYVEHLIPGPNFTTEGPRGMQLFFSFYFAMTGMHALHMVIGIVILGILVWMAGKGRFTSEYYSPVEMTGLYWHFVDIVWIFLFPLLYLLGLHVHS